MRTRLTVLHMTGHPWLNEQQENQQYADCNTRQYEPLEESLFKAYLTHRYFTPSIKIGALTIPEGLLSLPL